MKRYIAGLVTGLFFSAIFALAQGQKAQQGGTNEIYAGSGGVDIVDGHLDMETDFNVRFGDASHYIGRDGGDDIFIVDADATDKRIIIAAASSISNPIGSDPLISLQSTGTNADITLAATADIDIDAGALLGLEGNDITMDVANEFQVVDGGTSTVRFAVDDLNGPRMGTVTQIGLPITVADGTIRYCTDCNPDATCTGSGSGAFAFRVNGSWTCELN